MDSERMEHLEKKYFMGCWHDLQVMLSEPRFIFHDGE